MIHIHAALRTLILAFVLVAGAITLAGPESKIKQVESKAAVKVDQPARDELTTIDKNTNQRFSKTRS